MPKPRQNDYEDDDQDRGSDAHPSLCIEVEAWAFEAKLLVRHGAALHLKIMKSDSRGPIEEWPPAKFCQMTDTGIAIYRLH